MSEAVDGPRPPMSAQEVANEIGVTERTVRRQIASGELPAEKRGRTFAIRIEDVKGLERGALLPTTSARSSKQGRQLASANTRNCTVGIWSCGDRVRQLENALAEERRRSARLEVQADLLTPAAA